MKKGLFCLLIFAALCGAAQAETIFFRNGKIIRGEIVRQTHVYIRLKSRYGVAEREFLLENIERIVKDGEVTYKRDVMEGFEEIQGDSLDELPEDVQRVAEAMAISLIEEAMRKVDIPNMEGASESVKLIAQQKVDELLRNAVLNAQEVPPAVQYAATEIATALIEESVRNVVVMPSLDEAPNQVKEAAREKAAALIDEALRSEEIDFLTNAPEVKLAAKQKASALIEAAMKEMEVPVIPPREFDATEVEIVMREAIQKRVDESAWKEGSERIQGFSEVEEEFEEEGFEEEFVPEIEVLGQKVNPPKQFTKEALFTDEDYQMDADEMVSAEVQKAIAAEHEKMGALKKETQISPKKLLLGLGTKDFLIVGLIIILLFVLLTQRRQGAKGVLIDHHDVAISSSLTYQNLPDELKGRITSSDVTVILKLQAKFQDQVGLAKASKENKMVIIDDHQMIEYVLEHAKREGHSYRREDIEKVMEAQEKALEEDASSEV